MPDTPGIAPSLATLIVEPCTCGHRRGRHLGELAAGRCYPPCPCAQFTLDTTIEPEGEAA